MTWFRKSSRAQGVERRILFGGVTSMNFVMFQPLYRKLVTDPRVEVFLTGMHDGKDRPWPLYEPFGLPRCDIIRERDAKRQRFDAYVASDYHVVEGVGEVKIQLFHTLSFRRFFLGPLAGRFDALFLWGPYMREQFVASGMCAASDPRLMDIGCPAIDGLVNGTFSREAARAQLGIPSARPAVLLAPSFLPYGALRWGEALFTELLRLPVTIIVKLHELSYIQRSGGTDWRAVMNRLVASHDNLRIVTEPDPTRTLLAADVLVTDVSAMAYQQMVMDRPVVFIEVPEAELRRGYPSMDPSGWGLDGGARVDHPEALGAAVEDALSHPQRMADVRRRIAREAFFEPGGATARALRRLYELMSLAPREVSPEPVR